MKFELKNIHWFGNDDKLVGFSDSGMIITTPYDHKAIYIENENIWFGYFERPYFTAINIAEWSD